MQAVCPARVAKADAALRTVWMFEYWVQRHAWRVQLGGGHCGPEKAVAVALRCRGRWEALAWEPVRAYPILECVHDALQRPPSLWEGFERQQLLPESVQGGAPAVDVRVLIIRVPAGAGRSHQHRALDGHFPRGGQVAVEEELSEELDLVVEIGVAIFGVR